MNKQVKGITFYDCLMKCANTPDLITQFDRLWKTNLSSRGSPLDLMIDEACGRLEGDLVEFINFVYECIWLPIKDEITAAPSNSPK